MNKTTKLALAALLVLGGKSVFAGVNCQGPTNNNGRWSLVCSEDGAASADLKCNWNVNITTEGGGSGNVNVKATIGRNQKNVTVWSDDRFNGKKITAASMAGGGSCST